MTVRVENIVKRFGNSSEAAAVADVSFEARPKAITTLLGPSGSGKSTLLRLIAGLETPDRGRVFIDGQDVTALSPQHRNVGFVFQSYALFKHMTVADNIAFGMKIRGLPKAQIAEAGGRSARAGAAPGVRHALSVAALWRTTPTRGARARARHRTQGAPARRALRRARHASAPRASRVADAACTSKPASRRSW